jgi:hypothetical protein
VIPHIRRDGMCDSVIMIALSWVGWASLTVAMIKAAVWLGDRMLG